MSMSPPPSLLLLATSSSSSFTWKSTLILFCRSDFVCKSYRWLLFQKHTPTKADNAIEISSPRQLIIAFLWVQIKQKSFRLFCRLESRSTCVWLRKFERAVKRTQFYVLKRWVKEHESIWVACVRHKKSFNMSVCVSGWNRKIVCKKSRACDAVHFYAMI